MKKKGFTLVELLVVIAIIALLAGILMPALSRARQFARRLVCGTNLSSIGKAVLMYANNNDGDYPLAGIGRDRWSQDGFITDWQALTRENAFVAGRYGAATIASSLYLLVKYGGVPPKQFICKGDARAEEFRLSGYATLPQVQTVEDVWEFGRPGAGGLGPAFHCSYSYHMPYSLPPGTLGFPVTASSSPKSPLCADRNPYLDTNAQDYIGLAATYVTWDVEGYTDPAPGAPDNKKCGNSAAHQRKGQNVLYNDFHVEFEETANVGIENDNIWKRWDHAQPLTAEERQVLGSPPVNNGDGRPWGAKDAYLVNEGNRPEDLP